VADAVRARLPEELREVVDAFRPRYVMRDVTGGVTRDVTHDAAGGG
jgi:hypothetical protein